MKQLDVQDLITLCTSSQALLLDVREPWEIELASISLPDVATKHIPMGSIPDRLDDLATAHSIVCVCHHGVRSQQVVAYLERHGFESVYNLAGGIDAWSVKVDRTVPRY